MKRNRIAIALLVAALVTGAILLSRPAPKPQAVAQATPVVAEQIRTNVPGPLPPAPPAYTVLAVPSDYATDRLSQDLLLGFQRNPTLVALRSATAFKSYGDGNAEYEHLWQRWTPEVSRGVPVVIVMHGNTPIYKRSGVSSHVVAREIKAGGILDRIRPNRPKPCPVCPEPTPEPTTEPIPEPLPETPIPETLPPIVEEESNPLYVALAALAGGLVAWLVTFRRGM